MKRVLITGATGNVGRQVIHFLTQRNSSIEVVAAVRSIDKAKVELSEFKQIDFVSFDITEPSTFKSALNSIDTVFLLRPPEISDVNRYILPLVRALQDFQIMEIVFLSVQGAERSQVIPHNKIERLIKESGLGYVFLRPSYFMQNLTTLLLDEIIKECRITLPAGNAKFNWVDIVNIAELTALVIEQFDDYKSQVLEITGPENLSFYDVTQRISKVLGISIMYNSLDPLTFYLKKRSKGLKSGFIIVMILLYFLPRFQKEPRISDDFRRIMGKAPSGIGDFLKREGNSFKCI